MRQRSDRLPTRLAFLLFQRRVLRARNDRRGGQRRELLRFQSCHSSAAAAGRPGAVRIGVGPTPQGGRQAY